MRLEIEFKMGYGDIATARKYNFDPLPPTWLHESINTYTSFHLTSFLLSGNDLELKRNCILKVWECEDILMHLEVTGRRG